MMAENTLKRCPFCGSLATYVWDEVNETWTAGCTNSECIACVNSTMMYGWPRDGSTIEEAGEMWNKRELRGDV